ncbi:MAG: yliJ [Myxococcaceae bacterium]|nr:yliJ [Myxococcaceae bacterium]
MLKIWGRISSLNVRKVVLAAQWLSVPFERIDAGGQYGITNTPEYLGRNPNALVPLLDDEGFELWESNAIVRYLCAKHATGTLYPESLQARFDAERWMDWQQTTLNPAGRDAFVQLIRTNPVERAADLIAKSVAATKPLLTLLDRHLAHQPFMAGSSFTMADVPIACELHRWWGLPLEHEKHEHLERWYLSIKAQPTARGVLDLTLS